MSNSSKMSPPKFFALTFTLSWLIWIPLILGSSQISEGLSSIVRLFGVLMPSISAMILTSYYFGKTGINQLFSRFKIWRVSARWWIISIAVYPSLLLIAGIIYNLIVPQSVTLLPIDIVTLMVNVIFLAIASLGEEIGWRGVALPELQKRYSPLMSSLILGLLTAIWHIPFWILIGTLSQYGPVYFAMNFLFIVPTNFFLTWFFNNTKGSLLFPVLFHVSFNIVNVAIFPVTGIMGAFALFLALQFIVMLATLPALSKMSKTKNALVSTKM